MQRTCAARRLLRGFRVVGIVGPRQVGKTILAARIGATSRGPVHRFDLEDSRDLDRLAEALGGSRPHSLVFVRSRLILSSPLARTPRERFHR